MDVKLPGLLLGTKAPVMTPNGVDFCFLFLSGCEATVKCGVQDTEAFHQSLLHPSAWYKLKDGPSDTI